MSVIETSLPTQESRDFQRQTLLHHIDAMKRDIWSYQALIEKLNREIDQCLEQLAKTYKG